MREPEPEIGEPVSFLMRKWDGSQHRQTTMVYLGSDEYGRWLAIPTGIDARLPGSPSVNRAAHVMLVPDDRCFLAHFNAAPSQNAICADVTTAPEFGHDGNGWVVAAADMDLDVVRRRDGRIWIEDEDEFAEHTVSYGYPADVVATTRNCGRAADRRAGGVRAIRHHLEALDRPGLCDRRRSVNGAHGVTCVRHEPLL